MSEELEMPRDAHGRMRLPRDEQGRVIWRSYGMSREEFEALDELAQARQYLFVWANSLESSLNELKGKTEINDLSALMNSVDRGDAGTFMLHMWERDNIRDVEIKIAAIARSAVSDLTCLKENFDDSPIYFILIQIRNVQTALDMWSDLISQLIPLGQARSEFASEGGVARAANDPKQKEKGFVFQCWQDWQKSKTTENSKGTYSSKAAFARDMLEKYEHLISQKKIEDWCREWEKAHPAG